MNVIIIDHLLLSSIKMMMISSFGGIEKKGVVLHTAGSEIKFETPAQVI
jgi:hypothetical protein